MTGLVSVCLCHLIAPLFLVQEAFDAEKTAQLFEEADSFSSSVERNLALIEAGADPNGRDERGYAVLIIAGYNGNDEMVDALVRAKADLDAQGPDGVSALMVASGQGKWTIVPKLLEAGAKVDLADSDGWTALMWAAKNGNGSVCDALIKAGANVNVKAQDQWSPLLLAVRHGHGSVVEKLFDAGAKLDSNPPKGVPAAILAVLGGDSEVVRAVVEKTGEPNPVDSEGWTPLMVAAQLGDAECVMDLLRAGADPAFKNAEGKTALDKAGESGDKEAVALLGGEFQKLQPSGGVTLNVPCKPLEGEVAVNLAVEEDSVVFAAFYPKPLAAYLGGFQGGTKKVSADVSIELDTDLDRSTGKTKEWGVSDVDVGTDLEISWSELRTSVRDEKSGAYVSRQVLDPSIEAFGETPVSQKLEEFYPSAERDVHVIRVRVPLDVMGLEKGQKVRIVAKVGFCDPMERTAVLE